MYRPNARYTPPPSLGAIRQACWREEVLTIGYTDEHGSATQRAIPPLAIIYTEGRLVVLAWCRLRAAFRMFRMDRIVEARRQSGSFRPERASLLRAYLEALEIADAAWAGVSPS